MMIEGLGETYSESRATADSFKIPWWCSTGILTWFDPSACLPAGAADLYSKAKYGTIPLPVAAGAPKVPPGWDKPPEQQPEDLLAAQEEANKTINEEMAKATRDKIQAAIDAGTYNPEGTYVEDKVSGWFGKYWPLLAIGVFGVVMARRD